MDFSGRPPRPSDTRSREELLARSLGTIMANAAEARDTLPPTAATSAYGYPNQATAVPPAAVAIQRRYQSTNAGRIPVPAPATQAPTRQAVQYPVRQQESNIPLATRVRGEGARLGADARTPQTTAGPRKVGWPPYPVRRVVAPAAHRQPRRRYRPVPPLPGDSSFMFDNTRSRFDNGNISFPRLLEPGYISRVAAGATDELPNSGVRAGEGYRSEFIRNLELTEPYEAMAAASLYEVRPESFHDDMMVAGAPEAAAMEAAEDVGRHQEDAAIIVASAIRDLGRLRNRYHHHEVMYHYHEAMENADASKR